MLLCSTYSCTRSMSSRRRRAGGGGRSAGWNTSLAPSAAGDRPAASSGRTSFGSVVSITARGCLYAYGNNLTFLISYHL